MNATDWTEDNELGVAVRDNGGSLQIRGLTDAGRERMCSALRLACTDYDGSYKIIFDAWGKSLVIDPAHRLAFARALSPIECEVICNK
jgi:hypothetical protein